MYSAYNEEKSVVAEGFISTLKNNISKYMTAVSLKNTFYFNVLDDNKTAHRTIKMKPIDVTTYSYAEQNEDSNENDCKFKVGSYVKISKYKYVCPKGYTPN